MDLQKTFLLTFRCFMTPYELMESLICRYCATPPSVRPTDDLTTLKKARQVPVRLRVLNVIRYWIDNHAYDFEDPKLANLAQFFLTNVVSVFGNQQLAQAIVAALQRKVSSFVFFFLRATLNSLTFQQLNKDEQSKEEAGMLHPPPDPIMPVPSSGGLCFLDFHPTEFARQMALIEFQLYRLIKPKELMNQSWSKRGKEENSPNILACISSLNKVNVSSAFFLSLVNRLTIDNPASEQMCKLVVRELVTQTDQSRRTKTLKKMIALGTECFKINNFNGGMEILAGLSNSAVTRLKKTWDALDSSSKESFQALSEYPEKNFKKIRESLRTANPPCVPYLGESSSVLGHCGLLTDCLHSFRGLPVGSDVLGGWKPGQSGRTADKLLEDDTGGQLDPGHPTVPNRALLVDRRARDTRLHHLRS